VITVLAPSAQCRQTAGVRFVSLENHGLDVLGLKAGRDAVTRGRTGQEREDDPDSRRQPEPTPGSSKDDGVRAHLISVYGENSLSVLPAVLYQI
jgi:hypothetical protein